MARARFSASEVGEQFAASLAVIKRHLDPANVEVNNALLSIEAFAAVSIDDRGDQGPHGRAWSVRMMTDPIEVERETLERIQDVLGRAAQARAVDRELANEARMLGRIVELIIKEGEQRSLVPLPDARRELADRELLDWAARHALLALEDGAVHEAMGYLRRAVRSPVSGGRPELPAIWPSS